MKKYLVLFILIFISFIELFSQKDFREGYIITNNKDTIYGLINYKGSIISSRKCMFKENLNTAEVVYTPEEINAYRFTNGKFYISKNVEIGSGNSLIFLEYLVNGIVDAYYYRDTDEEHYLIEQMDGKLFELDDKERDVVVNGVSYTKKSTEYKGALKYLFKESPMSVKQIDNLVLNHKSLINITSTYHNDVCSTEECVIYKKTLPETVWKYGIIIGINITSYNVNGDVSLLRYYLYDTKFESDMYPSIGLYYKFSMPRLNEKLFLQHEIAYQKQEMKANNTFYDQVFPQTLLSNIHYVNNVLHNSISIKYESTTRVFAPTFQIGGFFSYTFKDDYTRDLEILWNSGSPYREIELKDNPFTKFNYGINIGIGIIKELYENRALIIDIKYQHGFGYIEDLNTKSFILNVGFQL